MYLIGDVHGKTDTLNRLVRTLPEGKIFQLGDMGLGFKNVFLPHYDLERFQFIRGNHDSPQACAAHPNYAGEYGYLEKEGVFYIGGAWSIDFMYRVPGKSWWPDEELSQEQLHSAWELYSKVKPKIVLSHEAPMLAGTWMLTQNGIAFSNPDNPTNVEKDDMYKKYKINLGIKETRTGKGLQDMLDVHIPDKWYFGHYHNSAKFNLRGCDFQCLNELEVTEI